MTRGSRCRRSRLQRSAIGDPAAIFAGLALCLCFTGTDVPGLFCSAASPLLHLGAPFFGRRDPMAVDSILPTSPLVGITANDRGSASPSRWDWAPPLRGTGLVFCGMECL